MTTRADQRVATLSHTVAAALTAAFVTACGSPMDIHNFLLQGSGTSGKGHNSSSDNGDDASADAVWDLHGEVVTSTGSSASLLGWSIVLLDHDRDGARVGEIDASGHYELLKVSKRHSKTLALLSPDSILRAVLSLDSPQQRTVRQFVRPERQELPQLVLDGPVITFRDTSGITVEPDLASDMDGDGVPDGAEQLGGLALAGGNGMVAGSFATGSSTIDLDLDGTPNELDPDIDGDGVVNVLDPDDNGNAVPDVFDGDANGNLVADTYESVSDHHSDLGWTSVTLERRLTGSRASDAAMHIGVFFKLSAPAPHLAQVTLRGAPSLLNGATLDNGSDSQAWDRMLLDDGESCDASANDGLFGACVTLAEGKSPRSLEMVFIDLTLGAPDSSRIESLPHTFAATVPGGVAAQFDTASRAVQLVGNPFGPGTTSDFIWVASTFDAQGAMTFTSMATPGTTRSLTLPEDVLGTSVAVTAQSLAAIPGFPWQTVTSARVPMD